MYKLGQNKSGKNLTPHNCVSYLQIPSMKATLVTMALAVTAASAGDPRCHDTPADGGNCRGSFLMWTYTVRSAAEIGLFEANN